MGSQPSKSKIYPSPVQGELREEAKEIKNEEDDNQSLRQTEDKSDELQSKIDELLSELGVAEKRASLAELKNNELELKLKEARMLSTSDSEICSRSTPAVVLQERSRSSDAKEQFIHKLKCELENAKKECELIRSQCDRKLQAAKKSLTQYRAETALLMFELKEQNSQLSEENSSLIERIHNIEKVHHSKSQDELEKDGSDSRMQLILDLSEQISSLNGELEEAQSTIVKLHKELDTSQTAVKKEDSCSRHSFKTVTEDISSFFED